MTNEEFEDYIVTQLRARISGPGARQYDRGSRQAIEDKSNRDLIEEAIEECLDQLVYLLVLAQRAV